MRDAAAVAPLSVAEAQRITQRALAAIDAVLSGHKQASRLGLAAILARGHVLIEDVPGVGKTTLARAVARVLGGRFNRIQFTADMLPGDVLGLQVFDQVTQSLAFRPGPLFAEVVLADEINRASPKTQSAMLEAMAERAVTMESYSHALPEAFCVLATQNPVEQHGAYPLPESQLDRFMVSVSLGYPPPESELALLEDPEGPKRRLSNTTAQLDIAMLIALQEATAAVAMHRDVAHYILALARHTRTQEAIELGISPRGAMALAQLARAWALMDGRTYVVPEDVRQLAPFVWAHRLTLRDAASTAQVRLLIENLIEREPMPQ